VAAIVMAALYFAREVLIPVTLAMLLSFVLSPLVELLRRGVADFFSPRLSNAQRLPNRNTSPCRVKIFATVAMVSAKIVERRVESAKLG
jgi:hypothetical protein